MPVGVTRTSANNTSPANKTSINQPTILTAFQDSVKKTRKQCETRASSSPSSAHLQVIDLLAAALLVDKLVPSLASRCNTPMGLRAYAVLHLAPALFRKEPRQKKNN